MLSYLPTAHVFQYIVRRSYFTPLGASHLVLSKVTALKLFEDCALVRPTLFIGVPRVYSKTPCQSTSHEWRAKGARGQHSLSTLPCATNSQPWSMGSLQLLLRGTECLLKKVRTIVGFQDARMS